MLVPACQKTVTDVQDDPVREKQIPEKVEAEILGIMEKDWKSLLDTLKYFNSNILKQGKTNGTGPDGVYYELAFGRDEEDNATAVFSVRDSLFAKATGIFFPIAMKVETLGTVLGVSVDGCAVLHLNVGNVGVAAPPDFLFDSDSSAELSYENSGIGYITRETYENEDYSTGKYFVIHYYHDPRTFAFNDTIFH